MSCGYAVVLAVSGLRGDLNKFMRKAKGPVDTIWEKTESSCVLQILESWQADQSISFAEVCERIRGDFGMPSLNHARILPATDTASVDAAIAKAKANLANENEAMKKAAKAKTKLSLMSLCPPSLEEKAMPWGVGRRKWLSVFGVNISDPATVTVSVSARGHMKTAKYEFIGHGDGHYQWFAAELAARFPDLDFTMTCQSPLTDDDHWLAATVAAKGEWHMIQQWYPRQKGCPGKWCKPEELARFLDGKAADTLRMLKKELGAKECATPNVAPSS